MDTMNALLRMQSEAEDGVVDHFVSVWMKQLRELAYDSEDSSTCTGSASSPGPTTASVPACSACSRRSGRAGALRVRSVLSACARAIAISERHARYGVNRDALRRAPVAPLLPSPGAAPDAKNADRHRLVGIQDQAKILVAELLKKPRPRGEGEGEPKAVFSIVGFGGLGKTTLAMEVCRMVEADFPFQAMVAVSQAFEPNRDLQPLLKRVLQQVLKDRKDNDNQQGGQDGDIDRLDVNQLATKLQQDLTGKRYLIVIDDVWNERAWDLIQCRLPKNNCGSRVLVTTRIESVAKACSQASGGYIHLMKPLSPEDSRELFLSRAFGSKDAKCPSDDHEKTLESILGKCGGMPLAIVSIASVLEGYTSPESNEKWETICKSMGSQMEMHPTLEGMSQILTLSYNHLPHELKSCMMYISIFLEDYAIRKDRLLHRWIAEGLIPKKRGLTMLEVAKSYFNELLSRNMIFYVQGQEESSVFDYDGKKKYCRVHDMLLEVMVSKSLEYNFVSILGGQYNGMSYDRIRHLSIHEHEGVDSKIKIHTSGGQGGNEEMNVSLQQHVRSLSMFQLHGNKLLLDQLRNFSLLRVLDLEGCMCIESKHVRYACQLHLLKFLSFKGTNIGVIPRQIRNLQHLQTLDLRDVEIYRRLPATLMELEKLEHLLGACWNPPKKGLSRMKALCEMGSEVVLSNVEVTQELGKLQQLQVLGISVHFTKIHYDDAEAKKAFVEEVANSLGKLYSLWSLNIKGRSGELECLHRLQEPPPLLRHLFIDGSVGQRLPTWVRSLTHLVEIVLDYVLDLQGDEPFETLCELHSLQSLRMEGHCYPGKKLVARSSHKFPALVNFAVSCHNGFQAFRFEAGSMPKLEKLMFALFYSTTRVTGIEHLTTKLKEVQVVGHGHVVAKEVEEAYQRAVEAFKAESAKRAAAGSSQFQVIAKDF